MSWFEPSCWKASLDEQVDRALSEFEGDTLRREYEGACRRREHLESSCTDVAMAVLSARRLRLRGKRRKDHIEWCLGAPAEIVLYASGREPPPTGAVLALDLLRAQLLSRDVRAVVKLARQAGLDERADIIERRLVVTGKGLQRTHREGDLLRKRIGAVVAQKRSAFRALAFFDIDPSPPGVLRVVMAMCAAILARSPQLRMPAYPGRPEKPEITLPLLLETLVWTRLPSGREAVVKHTGLDKRYEIDKAKRAFQRAIDLSRQPRPRELFLDILAGLGEKWAIPLFADSSSRRGGILRESRIASVAQARDDLKAALLSLSDKSPRRKKKLSLTLLDVFEACEETLMLRTGTILEVRSGELADIVQGGADRTWRLGGGGADDTQIVPRVF
jgi:hypothetical protein